MKVLGMLGLAVALATACDEENDEGVGDTGVFDTDTEGPNGTNSTVSDGITAGGTITFGDTNGAGSGSVITGGGGETASAGTVGGGGTITDGNASGESASGGSATAGDVTAGETVSGGTNSGGAVTADGG